MLPGALGRHLVAQRLGEAAEHQFGEHLADEVARGHRARAQRVDDAFLGRGNRDHLQRAGVVRDARRDDALHAERGVGVGVALGRIDAEARGGRGAGVVHVDGAVGHRERGLQLDRRLVAVQRHRGAPGAARQLADRRAHRLARGGDDVFAQRVEIGEAELLQHRGEAARGHLVAGHQAEQVAAHLQRLARVAHQHREQRFVRLSGVHHLHVRDVQAFLVDRGGFGDEAAPADVDDVAGGGEKADQAALQEGRRDGDEVEQVPGAHPRVVGDQHVAGLERARRKALEEVRHRGGHGVDVAGRAGHRLREHAPPGVVDARRQVARLARDGAERGLEQHVGLLLDHRDQAVPEDLP